MKSAMVIRAVWVCLFVMLTGAAIAHAQVPGEQIEYYAHDAVGSVRAIFNPSGTVVGRGDYLPFGEELPSNTGLPNERFTGQARDPEAGLDHFHARSYQVRHGRFTRPDPVLSALYEPQRWNRYTYALNNPLGAVDPSGRDPIRLSESVTVVGKAGKAPYAPYTFFIGGGFESFDVLSMYYEDDQWTLRLLQYLEQEMEAHRAAQEAAPDPNQNASLVDETENALDALSMAVPAVGIVKNVAEEAFERIGRRLLKAALNLSQGNRRMGLEHVLLKHGYRALGAAGRSQFLQGVGEPEIRSLLKEALELPGSRQSWRAENTTSILEVSLGRVVGTDPSGAPTTWLRIVANERADVISMYPIPKP